jgi:hypothetical protein
MVTPPSTVTLSSSAGTTAPESLLIGHIQAHVKKGELAQERADKSHEKAEQHFIAAGRYLTTLKVNYARDWSEWETLLRVKVKLSTGRASELMQLADGRKDLHQIRDGKAQSMVRLRARNSLHHGGEQEDDQERAARVATALPNGRAPLRGTEASTTDDPHLLHAARQIIDGLIHQTIRETTIRMVISGERQTQFASFTQAVADLYQRLSRAGR